MSNENMFQSSASEFTDTVTIPRCEYDSMQEAVITLKIVRNVYGDKSMSTYNREGIVEAVLFPLQDAHAQEENHD